MKKKIENLLDDEIIAYDEDSVDDLEEPEEISNTNLPIGSSSIYPRIYVGDSAKPLQGQFNQSEYTDDNITRTWTGLLTSYYG